MHHVAGRPVHHTNPEKPVRLAAQADTNFQGWHTAVFSNDGKKVVFTDEWGGGKGPMCQANSRRTASRTTAGSSRCRGATCGTIGGSWGAYWWNGMIYSSELDRGFDVLELQPSEQLSANEIAAAKLVTMTEYNPQSQPKFVWPAAFPVVRSYLDQLVRGKGLSSDRTTSIAAALDAAEQKSGAARATALNVIAKQVDGDVSGARDADRVRMMSAAIKALAAAK